MPMTGYDDPTRPKRPLPLPGQPTEKPEGPPPLGPPPPFEKPDGPVDGPIPLGPGDKPDVPPWQPRGGGQGNPGAFTNGGDLFGGGGAPAPPAVDTAPGMYTNTGGDLFGGSSNPQATTNSGDLFGGAPAPPPHGSAPGTSGDIFGGAGAPAAPAAPAPHAPAVPPPTVPPPHGAPLAGAPAGGAPAAPVAPAVELPPPPVPMTTGPAPGAPAAPAAPAAPEGPNLNSTFKDALMKMLNDNQQAPSVNDPAIKGQADAFALGQTRSTQQARSAMAERAAAQGGSGVDSEVFDQNLSGLYQQQGEAQGSFNAGLVGQELQQRRQQLMSAAALAGNQLTSEQQMSLQKQLAETDAAIKREGMAQQGGQFGQSLTEQRRQSGVDAELKRLGIDSQTSLGRGDLDLRRMLGSGQLSLGLLQALMQNNQFGQGLGAQMGMFNSSQNQNALLQMLGQLGG